MLIPTSLFPLRLAMIHPHSLQFRRECDNHNNPLSVFSSSESHFVPPESFVPLALWSEASYLGGNEGINGSNQISESNIFPPHQSSNVNSSSFQFHQNLQGLSNPNTPPEEPVDMIESEYGSAVHHIANALSIHDSGHQVLPDEHVHVAQADYSGCMPTGPIANPPMISISSQVSEPLISHNDSHTIERLPASDVGLVDGYLERQHVSGNKKWKCCYAGCHSSASWKNKDAARTHVYKHLNETKLFKCIKCDVYFASEKNAIRHCNYRGRNFACSNCSGVFTRVDYRNKHQKACIKKV